MKILLGLSVALFLFRADCTGQTHYTIYGRVIGSTAQPVSDGIASLFIQKDSVLVKWCVIKNGAFAFSNIKKDHYFIKINSLGYEDTFLNVPFDQRDTLQIQLKQKPVSLKEIEVASDKDVFTYKNGNIKVAVENTYLSNSSDAIELLTRLPNIQVSGDRESISIIGKGNPIVYLENQRITVNELNSLSVNDIKSIEVINNPSSKYEAEGRAVILITMRTSLIDRSRIDITQTASKKRFFESRTGVNTSYKKKNMECKGYIQYNHINRYEGLDGVLNSDMNNYRSNYEGTSIGLRKQFFYRFGGHYQINKSDYFSLSVNGRLQVEDADVNTRSYSMEDSQETVAISKNSNYSERPSINTNLNYQKKFEKINGQLFIGAQYAQFRTNVSSRILNSIRGPLIPSEYRQQNFTVDVISSRIDFEKRILNGIKWESGTLINSSKSVTMFNVLQFPTSNGELTFYSYEENNQALYSQVSGKYKRVDHLFGLRAESTQLHGGYADSAQFLLDKKFIYLFPKLQITFSIDSLRTISFNYSRNIRRPNYSNANQVSNYITPFLERTNSINISPSTSNEISINFLNKKYSVNASIYQIRNSISYIMEYDPSISRYRLINRNIEEFNGVSFSLTVPYRYKILTSTNEFVATMNQVRDIRADQLKTKPFYYIYSSNKLNLPASYTFVLSAWYTTTQYEGLFITNQKFAVDLSLSKVFFKRLTCSINALDIFRSLNNTESFTINNIYASTTYIENVKEFSIALKFTFGKIKDTKFKDKEVNENGNRLN